MIHPVTTIGEGHRGNHDPRLNDDDFTKKKEKDKRRGEKQVELELKRRP